MKSCRLLHADDRDREIVASRYGISRLAQDEYALQSQQRTAAAQRAGLFADEIVPLTASRLLFDKEGNPNGHESVVADRDECNRASTTLEALQSLSPVWKSGKWVQQGAHITRATPLSSPMVPPPAC